MLWTVAYRDEYGQKRTAQVDAETRSLVISKMRERGFAVINISDASGLANDARKRSENRAILCHRIGLALVMVTVLSGIAWYFFVRRDASFHNLFEQLRPSGPISIRDAGQ